jgi:hypothetical protein
MNRKLASSLLLVSICFFNSTLAVSAEPAEAECAQILKTTAYPGLAEEQNEEIIKQMKEAEKKMGACAALNIYHCLIGNPNCKNAKQ